MAHETLSYPENFRPTAFQHKFLRDLKIESRGETGWAISAGGATVYSRIGTWVYEPFSSRRTEEFIAETRFTLDEAFKIVEELVETDPILKAESEYYKKHGGAP